MLYRRRDGDFGVIEPVVGGDYTRRARSRARRTARANGHSTGSGSRATPAVEGTAHVDPVVAVHEPLVVQVAAEPGHVPVDSASRWLTSFSGYRGPR